jgi:membrane-bound serine protease (ClpP class)
MRNKLVPAVIISLIYGFIGVVIIVWGLPALGINLSLPWRIGLFLALAIFAIISFRIRRTIFNMEPMAGLSSMTGTRGRVVHPLTPKGTVRIKGELWEAVSDTPIGVGETVAVVSQDGLRLTVRRTSPTPRRRPGARSE